MDSAEMIFLITSSRNTAHEALKELKLLDRAGWIDLTYYALASKDRRGRVRIHESSDPAETVGSRRTATLTGTLAGCLFAPAEAAFGGIAAAPRSRRPCERPDETIAAIRDNLDRGSSALVVVLDERFAERAVQELDKHGHTIRRQLHRAQREAVLRTSASGFKAGIQWLEHLIDSELRRLEGASGEKGQRILTGIAARRAELSTERERLHERLSRLRDELEADYQEMKGKLSEARNNTRPGIARTIDDIETAIGDCNEELALSLLDHLDSLAVRDRALRAQLSKASADAKIALAGQLHELEEHIRKSRAELTAALQWSSAETRQCMDRMRSEAAAGKSAMYEALREKMKTLGERHAILKADLRRLETHDERISAGLIAGFRKSWKALRDSIKQARRRRR
jgi:uncharacterized membrane protein